MRSQRFLRTRSEFPDLCVSVQSIGSYRPTRSTIIKAEIHPVVSQNESVAWSPQPVVSAAVNVSQRERSGRPFKRPGWTSGNLTDDCGQVISGFRFVSCPDVCKCLCELFCEPVVPQITASSMGIDDQTLGGKRAIFDSFPHQRKSWQVGRTACLPGRHPVGQKASRALKTTTRTTGGSQSREHCVRDKMTPALRVRE